jgi:ADP-ribose pyrophosphatase YjhB (NUDIX family)
MRHSVERPKRRFVGTIITRKDGFVVAQHRDNNPKITGSNTWAVPGGVMEWFDLHSQRITSLRETFEEMRYLINPLLLEFLTRDVYWLTKKDKPPVLVERTILTIPYDGRQETRCKEGQEMRFISPEEIENLEFYIGHQEFFRLASRRARTG